MKTLYLFAILYGLCFQIKVYATQTSQNDEFETLFARFGDSTLIFSGVVPLGKAPKNLFIVSKKDDTVSLFVYHDAIPAYPELPSALAAYIKKEKFKRSDNGAAIDAFFDVHQLKLKKRQKLWRAIMAQDPWEMEDDSAYGSACPIIPIIRKDKNGNTVTTQQQSSTDLHSYFVTLITHSGVRRLRYYAPEVLEKTCPGKDGRQRVLKIKKLLLKYFNKDSIFWNEAN